LGLASDFGAFGVRGVGLLGSGLNGFGVPGLGLLGSGLGAFGLGGLDLSGSGQGGFNLNAGQESPQCEPHATFYPAENLACPR
jgi:hypothetical protein